MRRFLACFLLNNNTKQSINKMTLKQKFAMFPFLMTLGEEGLLRMGIDPAAAATAKEEIAAEAAEAVKAEASRGVARRSAAASYGSLNWNVVCQQAVQGFSKQALSPLTGVFSTDISGAAVDAANPEGMPRVTVPVVGLGNVDDVAVNPSDLDAIGSTDARGVPVKLDVLATAVDFPVTALMEGYKVMDLVSSATERLRRKAVAYVYGKLTAAATDAAGGTIAAPATKQVPRMDEGWDAGYVNRHLSAAIEADNVSLVVDRTHFAGLLPRNNDDLLLNQLAFEGVYKSGQVSAAGEGVIGFVAAKNAMAVGMRAPSILVDAYANVIQMQDGDTLLPLTMVQYYNPGKMTMRVVMMTAIGATRVVPESALILKETAAD